MREPMIYIGQFGAFWSLPLSKMKAFLDQAIADGGSYADLDKIAKRLKGQPQGIYRNEGGGYWSARSYPSGGYYEPLDWYPEDFAHARAELDEYA